MHFPILLFISLHLLGPFQCTNEHEKEFLQEFQEIVNRRTEPFLERFFDDDFVFDTCIVEDKGSTIRKLLQLNTFTIRLVNSSYADDQLKLNVIENRDGTEYSKLYVAVFTGVVDTRNYQFIKGFGKC